MGHRPWHMLGAVPAPHRAQSIRGTVLWTQSTQCPDHMGSGGRCGVGPTFRAAKLTAGQHGDLQQARGNRPQELGDITKRTIHRWNENPIGKGSSPTAHRIPFISPMSSVPPTPLPGHPTAVGWDPWGVDPVLPLGCGMGWGMGGEMKAGGAQLPIRCPGAWEPPCQPRSIALISPTLPSPPFFLMNS